MHIYEPLNDPIIENTTDESTSVVTIDALINAREDRHMMLEGLAATIRAMSIETRRELFKLIGAYEH